MLESLTMFDAIAVTVILVSAIMALARGFMRELATLGAFVAALAAALVVRGRFTENVREWLPETAPPWMPEVILLVLTFIIVYAIVAWFGQRLSKGIQGLEGIGILDRIAGAAFGLARGYLAIVFFVFLANAALDTTQIPSFIQDARTYPYFKSGADYININRDKVVERVQPALPLEDETVQ